MSKKYISIIIISIILLITAMYLFHIHRSVGNETSELKPVWKHGIRGGITEICVSVDGKVITSSSGMFTGDRYSFDEGEVKVWNKNTGALIQTVYEGKDPAWAIALSKDGKTLACSIGSKIGQWRLQDGVFKKERQFSISASALAYSPDGCFLACKSGNDVLVWNAKTGKLNWHRKERNIGAYVSSGKTRRPQHIVYNIDRYRWLYFSPDGQYLAVPVVYWIGENSYRKLTLLNSKTGKVQYAVDPHAGMDTACFSNDGALLAIGGFGRISLLKVKDLQLVKNITWGRMVLSAKEKHDIGDYGLAPFPISESLVFSPDDRMLAIGASWFENGLIQFRNVSSGALIRDITVNSRKVNSYPKGITAVVFSTSKNEFAVAANGYVALYRFPDSP